MPGVRNTSAGPELCHLPAWQTALGTGTSSASPPCLALHHHFPTRTQRFASHMNAYLVSVQPGHHLYSFLLAQDFVEEAHEHQEQRVHRRIRDPTDVGSSRKRPPAEHPPVVDTIVCYCRCLQSMLQVGPRNGHSMMGHSTALLVQPINKKISGLCIA
jgi:hypothetical protein